MKNIDIARAWKNPAYRRSLSAAERAQLPSSPAGAISLADEELRSVSGGSSLSHCCTCTPLPASVCTPCPPLACF
ncbi:MAG: mersacidin/lichenicidin family type 2 lantibiotic [Acidobacteriota bacterium]